MEFPATIANMREAANLFERRRHGVCELQMTGAKQSQCGRVIEVPKAIETHGIQTLQGDSLAVVEVQRHIDGLDQFQIRQSRNERLRLLEPAVKIAQHPLDRPQGRPRRRRRVEQQLSFVLAESRMVTVDRNVPIGQEEAFTLQRERLEAAALLDRTQQILAGFESEDCTGVEGARRRLLAEENGATSRRGGKFRNDDLHEVRRGFLGRAQAQTCMALRIQ